MTPCTNPMESSFAPSSFAAPGNGEVGLAGPVLPLVSALNVERAISPSETDRQLRCLRNWADEIGSDHEPFNPDGRVNASLPIFIEKSVQMEGTIGRSPGDFLEVLSD